ncbi:MAG: L,D-transpeptidase family protein [Candidatus Magasanikbacteria bacterium]|nr:L,D-transpeptidase family protein [Candidatus Magasanikbacteria bacterium]
MILSALVTTTIMASFSVSSTPYDLDADGLNDKEEISIYHTHPDMQDTDADGFSDGAEIKYGYSPLYGDNKKLSEVDTDKDGLNDGLEIALRADLNNPDTDYDGYLDGEEVLSGYNPFAGPNDRDVSRSVQVNRSTQTMDYFLNGVKIGTIPVSTGLRGMETPLGEFSILRKVPVVHYRGPGYDLPNTKWNLEFKRSYYLHGAYWHKQFGIKPMSHGCVNIAYKDAEKLYKFLDVGDKVKVVGETPKGKVKITAVTP